MNDTTTDTLHAIAVRTDTALADIYEAQLRNRSNTAHAYDTIRHQAGQRRTYGTRNPDWSGSLSDALDKVREVAASDAVSYIVNDARKALQRLEELGDENITLNAAEDALQAVYASHGGWSRFFLVKNNNGHIHSTMNCSTCRFDTEFGWLPALSGLTEAEAVAAHGSILCTICYPSAPVEWTNGENKAVTEAKAERAAAKAARDAAKRAKAIREDGEPIYVVTSRYDAERGRRGDRIETIAAAKSTLTDMCEPWRQADEFVLYAREVLAEAIAARTGKTIAEELADAARKAAKRR